MINAKKINKERLFRRKKRIRAKISGTAQKPRLSVFRSLKFISAQLIDDVQGVTLLSASQHELKDTDLTAVESDGRKLVGRMLKAYQVGVLLAKKAKDQKIETVVFDRAGRDYKGRVRMLAEGARQGGLRF